MGHLSDDLRTYVKSVYAPLSLGEVELEATGAGNIMADYDVEYNDVVKICKAMARGEYTAADFKPGCLLAACAFLISRTKFKNVKKVTDIFVSKYQYCFFFINVKKNIF